jgi:hypothetical protein
MGVLPAGAVLHRIEALPGEGRHAVTFRLADGTEQTAIVHLDADEVDVAEASLPSGWTRHSELFLVTAAAVRAFDEARRRAVTAGPALRDVPGGWDVSLGNVILGPNGVPTCTAHGEMVADGDGFLCRDCGARAQFA